MPNPLYPNLPSAIPPEVQQPRARNAAEGMWPSLTPKPPPGWGREGISLVKYCIRQGQSDDEIARRYHVSKQAVGQIRKLGR
jgi:hypothetical protein